MNWYVVKVTSKYDSFLGFFNHLGDFFKPEIFGFAILGGIAGAVVGSYITLPYSGGNLSGVGAVVGFGGTLSYEWLQDSYEYNVVIDEQLDKNAVKRYGSDFIGVWRMYEGATGDTFKFHVDLEGNRISLMPLDYFLRVVKWADANITITEPTIPALNLDRYHPALDLHQHTKQRYSIQEAQLEFQNKWGAGWRPFWSLATTDFNRLERTKKTTLGKEDFPTWAVIVWLPWISDPKNKGKPIEGI